MNEDKGINDVVEGVFYVFGIYIALKWLLDQSVFYSSHKGSIRSSPEDSPRDT